MDIATLPPFQGMFAANVRELPHPRLRWVNVIVFLLLIWFSGLPGFSLSVLHLSEKYQQLRFRERILQQQLADQLSQNNADSPSP